MEKPCEKMAMEKQHKVSVGRSLTMKFSNFRSRGKTVDKCERMTENVMEVGRPLVTSLSMGAMDRAQWQGNSVGTETKSHNVVRLCPSCSNRARSHLGGGNGDTIPNSGKEKCYRCMRDYRKTRGRSFDGLNCYQCEQERTAFSDSENVSRYSSDRMSVSASGSVKSGRQAPTRPPPCVPVHKHGAAGPLTKSWDRIYASRQGGWQWLLVGTISVVCI